MRQQLNKSTGNIGLSVVVFFLVGPLAGGPLFLFFGKLFSGENLLGDKSKGLNGECDFILSKSPKTLDLGAPIINITEAKQGDIENLKSQSQAAAQLLGARLFNEHHGITTNTIYGACTSGFTWVFLKLENNEIVIDSDRYSTSNLPQLLGVLQTIIDLSK